MAWINFDDVLTRREREVVSCVMEGCANKEVSKRFGISEETVKRHISNIFDKMGCGSRLEMALMYRDHMAKHPRYLRAYVCIICSRDVVIHTEEQEPRIVQISAGEVMETLDGACPDCAASVGVMASQTLSALRAKLSLKPPAKPRTQPRTKLKHAA